MSELLHLMAIMEIDEVYAREIRFWMNLLVSWTKDSASVLKIKIQKI